ncbi:MAG: protein kinase, partial [Myxococcota bacterium]
KAEDRASRTRAGVLKGKFSYMSPEQSMSSSDVDNRSDIFAVGILLYELVTGHHPFEGASDYETLKNVRRAKLTPPSRHVPDLPDAFGEIIVSTLARDPDERPDTAADVSEALQRWLLRDATVYGAKKLSELLAVHFADEIRTETEALEEYMRWLPPPAMIEEIEQGAAAHHAAGADLMATGEIQSDDRGAPTQIFVSEILAVTDGGPTDASKIPSDRDEGAEVTRTAHRIPAPPPDRSELTWAAVVKGFRREVDKAGHWAYVVSGAVMCGWIALMALIFGGDETEVVVITSKPSSGITLHLDDELIGNATPLVLDEVPEGEHTLVVNGEAFAEARYLFELVAGSPALIHIDLESDGGFEVLDPPEAAASIATPPTPESKLELEEPIETEPAETTALSEPRPEVPAVKARVPKPTTRVSRPSASKPKRSAPKNRGVSRVSSRRGGKARSVSGKPKLVKPCTGSGGRLSLMALGGESCNVIVNDKRIGKAPIFKKDVPIGACTIVVACHDGRTYMTRRTFKAGEHQQHIIEPDQLR